MKLSVWVGEFMSEPFLSLWSSMRFVILFYFPNWKDADNIVLEELCDRRPNQSNPSALLICGPPVFLNWEF